jgi:hypothetical protein
MPLALPLAVLAAPVDYDIVYVRAPRHGNNQNSVWPDTVRPLTPEAGAPLMLLHPNGSEETLFPRPELSALVDAPIDRGTVVDPNVSFDGRRVLFSYFHDRTDVNIQRGAGSEASLSYLDADIYVIDLATRAVQRLTHGGLTPNTGNGADFDCSRQYTNCPQIGVFNTGPAWLADGRIAFTSSRNNFEPPQSFNSGQRVLQLFVMDADGRNAEQIGYLNQAMALHPYQLHDGRLAFSSWEGQGVRDIRQFPLWAIRPDGTQWTSLSGYSERALVHHFMTQMRNGDIVVTRYYNLNNNGFGDLIRYPIDPPGPDFLPIDGPGAGDYPLEHKGIVRLTPFTTPEDFPAPCPGQEDNPYGSATNPSCTPAQRRGKLTQPAAAPNDDLLVVYSPGPCNSNGVWSSISQPYYDGGIYIIPGGQPISAPSQLQLVKNDAAYNEQWPRPVVSYSRIHGIERPAVVAALRNDGHEAGLDIGTPLGLIGSSSLIWRDTHPGQGAPWLEASPFNYTHEFLYDWLSQGADAGLYSDDDIYAVRILAMQPLTDRSYPNNGVGFSNVGNERLRILGEILVRRPGDAPVMHPDGVLRADTSFLAKVPADVPITFQTLDRHGMVLNMAQTWHQVRPGEARYDCGGCHAHSKEPLDFHLTAAGQPGFVPTDLTQVTPLLAHGAGGSTTLTTLAQRSFDVEYFRDVRPLLQRRCIGCHSGATPAGQLHLDADTQLVFQSWTEWPGTYFRLLRDSDGQFGIPPANDYWFAPQMTRYVRAFQSRQSLLIWKIWGARLDGRSNALRNDDLDYVGTVAHPAGVGVTGMPIEEKETLIRWIDIGAPIQLDSFRGYFEDDLRPTLSVVPSIEEAAATGTLSRLRIGTYDLESGIDATSLVVTLDVPVGGVPAGANLAGGRTLVNGGVVTLDLASPVSLAGHSVTLSVAVRDLAGHETRIERVLSAAVGSTTPSATPSPTATPTAGLLSLDGHLRYFASGAPVPGVTVGWSGPASGSTTSDSAGSFRIAGLGPGDWQIEPQQLGGAGSAVTAIDATYVLQAAVGLRSTDATQRIACDANGSGTLTAIDATFILQQRVGLIAQLPVAQRCNSDWMFLPVPMAGSGGRPIPWQAGPPCQRGAIAHDGLSASASGHDFTALLAGDCNGSWAAGGSGGLDAQRGRVHLGAPRRVGRLIRVPLLIDGSNTTALEADVRFEPRGLRWRAVRRSGSARAALVEAHERRPGSLSVALASSETLASGEVLSLIFEARQPAGRGTAVNLVRGVASR